MNVYNKQGFRDGVTESPLTNQDGVRINGTFVGFSPDNFKCSSDKLGPALVHAWYKPYNTTSAWDIAVKKCFAGTLTGDPSLDNRTITKESDLLKGPDGTQLRDKYPSDHLPVLLDFELGYSV
jgi:hypothetical protein